MAPPPSSRRVPKQAPVEDEDEDVSMADESRSQREDEESEAVDDEDDDGQDLLLGGEKKLVVLRGATTHAVSFQIEKEDHTLGNALRYFISKNPDVELCGYTIPHPSETKMNIRIQTWEDTDTTAFDALRKGLNDMIDACDVVTKNFTDARDEFDAQKADIAA